MKILLLGNTGQVGWELHRTLHTLGELTAVDYPQINLGDPTNIRYVVQTAQPDIIINATAYTDVDNAESQPELALAVNGSGVGILAEETKKCGAALIHYSTDYVFDGSKGEPYTERDQPNPLSVYGATKLAGERAIQDTEGAYLIIRTSWVYSLRRSCFVTKVLQWARQHETLRIVDDQVSSPTWARTLAESTAQVIAQGREQAVDYIQENGGLFHLAGGGSCSRYEWAQTILALDPNQEQQLVKEIIPAKTIDFPTAAERPLVSVLSNQQFTDTFKIGSGTWQTALSLMMQG